jgi:hypothetical protein
MNRALRHFLYCIQVKNGIRITNGAWNQDSIRSKMIYTLNANGKIAEEVFDNEIFEGLAGKRYFYKN